MKMPLKRFCMFNFVRTFFTLFLATPVFAEPLNALIVDTAPKVRNYKPCFSPTSPPGGSARRAS